MIIQIIRILPLQCVEPRTGAALTFNPASKVQGQPAFQFQQAGAMPMQAQQIMAAQRQMMVQAQSGTTGATATGATAQAAFGTPLMRSVTPLAGMRATGSPLYWNLFFDFSEYF